MERESATNQSVVSAAESVDLLKRLGLTEYQIAALRQQGFVYGDRRHGRSEVFKLRFRIDGRQKVRYLGTSPSEAAKVSMAVKDLQRARGLRHELQRLQKESRAGLKAAKKLLTPVLKSAGYQFYGLSVRQIRN